MKNSKKLVSLILFFVATSLFLVAQDNSPVRYFYDGLGRLIRVVDQSGNVASYSYDAVGNILGITRTNLPVNNGLSILNFTPQQGPIGQTVTIQGQGFNSTPSSNAVQFNGVAASVTSATTSSLVVTVPPSATTGTISVTVSGSSATSDTKFTITVGPLTSIAVSPSSVSIRSGTQQQFTATSTYADGSQQNITTLVTWTSSAPTNATISNANGSQGLTKVTGSGVSTITASSGAISGSAYLNVNPFTLLTINPQSFTMKLGATQQFTATATFSDGTTEDVTGLGNWTSSNLSVATITNVPSGLASGVGDGGSAICVSVGDYTYNPVCTRLTVVPVLLSLAVTPASESIPKGVSQQFVAMGSFNDGKTQDLTSSVVWNSSNQSVATINAQGLVRDVGVGITTISATSGLVSGSSNLTLTPAVPQAVSANPPRLVIQPSDTLQLAATMTMSDSSTRDVTQAVSWTTSDPLIATVSNTGFVTAVGSGSASITATSGSLSGTSVVIVTTAKALGMSRFGYVANSDSTISVYTVNAGSGQFRPNGYVQQPAGQPQAIALDPTNRFLYLAESVTNGISAYQVNLVNGSLTAIPGSPFAAGNFPNAIVIDPSGRFIYATNAFDNTISGFTIDSSSGALTSIAGSPYAVGIQPKSFVIDPSGQLLYAANSRDNTISGFTIDSTTGALTEIAGAPFTAQFGPTAMAPDPKGRFVYVANFGKGGGGSTSQSNPPRDFPINPTRRAKNPLRFAATPGSSPFEVSGAPSRAAVPLLASADPSSVFPFNARFSDLQVATSHLAMPSLAPFTAGRIFAQVGGPTLTGPSISVFAIQANGVLAEVPGSPFPVPNAPNSIVADPTGSYVYELDSSQISGFAVNQASGALTQLSGSPYTSEFNSSALTMDVSGQFLYAEGNRQDTQEFTVNPATGNVTPFATFPNRGGVGVTVSKATTAISFVPQFAYVASSGGTISGGGTGANNISGYSIDPVAGTLAMLSGSPFGEGLFPEFATSDSFGRFLYVANNCSDLACSASTGSVSAYDIATAGALSSVAGSPFSAGTNPVSVVVNPSGTFAYVANQGDNNISGYAIDQTRGGLTPLAGSPFVLPGGASGPMAVVMDPEGLYLYAAVKCVSNPCSGGGVSLYVINSAGALQPWFNALSALSKAQSIAADPMGRFVLVPDSASNDVVVLGTSRSQFGFSQVSGSPVATGLTPVSLALDPSGKFVYIANQGSNNVSAYNLDAVAGTLTAIPGSPFAAGQAPSSVTVDISGKFLYVVNNGDNTVSVFAIDPVSGTLRTVTGSPFPAAVAPISITTTGTIQ